MHSGDCEVFHSSPVTSSSVLPLCIYFVLNFDDWLWNADLSALISQPSSTSLAFNYSIRIRRARRKRVQSEHSPELRVYRPRTRQVTRTYGLDLGPGTRNSIRIFGMLFCWGWVAILFRGINIFLPRQEKRKALLTIHFGPNWYVLGIKMRYQ